MPKSVCHRANVRQDHILAVGGRVSNDDTQHAIMDLSNNIAYFLWVDVWQNDGGQLAIVQILDKITYFLWVNICRNDGSQLLVMDETT